MKKMRGILCLPKGATYDEMSSPVGNLTIVTAEQGLHAILWDTDRASFKYEEALSGLIKSKNEKIIMQTKKQLTEYFAK